MEYKPTGQRCAGFRAVALGSYFAFMRPSRSECQQLQFCLAINLSHQGTPILYRLQTPHYTSCKLF